MSDNDMLYDPVLYYKVVRNIKYLDAYCDAIKLSLENEMPVRFKFNHEEITIDARAELHNYLVIKKVSPEIKNDVKEGEN